jgi:hypothetical protein
LVVYHFTEMLHYSLLVIGRTTHFNKVRLIVFDRIPQTGTHSLITFPTTFCACSAVGQTEKHSSNAPTIAGSSSDLLARGRRFTLTPTARVRSTLSSLGARSGFCAFVAVLSSLPSPRAGKTACTVVNDIAILTFS